MAFLCLSSDGARALDSHCAAACRGVYGAGAGWVATRRDVKRFWEALYDFAALCVSARRRPGASCSTVPTPFCAYRGALRGASVCTACGWPPSPHPGLMACIAALSLSSLFVNHYAISMLAGASS